MRGTIDLIHAFASSKQPERVELFLALHVEVGVGDGEEPGICSWGRLVDGVAGVVICLKGGRKTLLGGGSLRHCEIWETVVSYQILGMVNSV